MLGVDTVVALGQRLYGKPLIATTPGPPWPRWPAAGTR